MKHVFYHANCRDGFAAALCAWKKFGDDATYTPVQYGDDVPEVQPWDEVFVLDFSFPAYVLREWSIMVDRLVVIDHHKTAFDDLVALARDVADIPADQTWETAFFAEEEDDLTGGDPFVTVHYSPHHSACVLAWIYFHHEGRSVSKDDIPRFFQYVEDRDLWKWELPDSRAFSYYLSQLDEDFRVWEQIAYAMQDLDEASVIIHAGRKIQRFVRQWVERVGSKAWITSINGEDVPIVNTSMFQSEMGEYLLEQYPDSPFAAMFFVKEDGECIYSLRSRGDFDVGEVAKLFGGGGHKAAAGYSSYTLYIKSPDDA